MRSLLLGILLAALPLNADADGLDPTQDGWTSRGLVVAGFERSFGDKLEPDGWDGELPRPLVAIVERIAKDPDDAARELTLLRKHASTLAVVWDTYELRAAEVVEGLAKAKALLASKDTGGAKDVLRGLITAAPTPVDRTKTPVHPIDAEIPAILQLAEILGAEKKYPELIGLVATLRSRSWIGSKEEETFSRVLRLERNYFTERAPRTGLRSAIEKASRFYNHLSDGGQLARAFYDSLGRFDLQGVKITELAKAKKGQWIHVPLPMASLNAERTVATVKYRDSYQAGRDCYKSGVRSINWHLKELRYEYTCRKYVPVKISIDVVARLAAPAPAFEPRFRRFVVVGKVAKAGGKLELVEAFVPDLTDIGVPHEMLGTITEDE